MSDENTKQTPEDAKENVEDATSKNQEPIVKMDVEKEQEAKLKAKYPGLRGPAPNAFLHKRLAKGQKYFDSGDYNMAKAKMGGAASKPVPPTQKLLLQSSTGEEIPTPEAIPHKKTCMIQSKLAAEGVS